MVRRLKSELPKDDFGQDRFPKRVLEALEVASRRGNILRQYLNKGL
jgi:hypothetical protein